MTMPRKQFFTSVRTWALLVLIWTLFPVLTTAAGQVDNTLYADLLKRYVVDGRVSYEGFKREEARLDQYLDILSNTRVDSLDEKERFAFYINIYNAFTIKLILTRYPDVGSIKDFGGLFSSPWKKEFIPLGGRTVSLDYIEHEILRPVFRDARVHFAVNCASRSCPPLMGEPYEGSRLEAQLDRQTRSFVNSPGNTRIQGDTVYVSRIFKWFKEDFNHDPVGFILSYADESLKGALVEVRARARVAYLDYDWSLNN